MLQPRGSLFCAGVCVDDRPPSRPRPVHAAIGAVARGSARAADGSPAKRGTGEPRPLGPSLPPGPRLLPKVAAARWKPGGPRGASEGGTGRPAAALQVPARGAPTRCRRPGHAGALGPRGSMKGGDQAYSRGPSLWLFAKCCCCLPCRGECAGRAAAGPAESEGWLGSAAGPGSGCGKAGGQEPAPNHVVPASLAERGLALGQVLTRMRSCSRRALTWRRVGDPARSSARVPVAVESHLPASIYMWISAAGLTDDS